MPDEVNQQREMVNKKNETLFVARLRDIQSARLSQ
jgi:hypothetical protein